MLRSNAIVHPQTHLIGYIPYRLVGKQHQLIRELNTIASLCDACALTHVNMIHFLQAPVQKKSKSEMASNVEPRLGSVARRAGASLHSAHPHCRLTSVECACACTACLRLPRPHDQAESPINVSQKHLHVSEMFEPPGK